MSPLDLIYSYECGETLISVGRFKYYINSIDNLSKFKWVSLMKKKSYVFQIFLQIYKKKKYVECLLNKNIVCVRMDWVVNIKTPTPSSTNLESLIVFLVSINTSKT